jgi:hypothetical protein
MVFANSGEVVIAALITLLIIGLILYLIFFICGLFIQGRPQQIIGVILALIFLLYALQRLGLLGRI